MIQQTGLFPHMTVAENVATVPRLLGWPKARMAARVEELLDVVGLGRDLCDRATPRSSPAGSASA